MRKTPTWLRRLGVGGISALTAGGASLVALAPPASATANFTLSRLAGVNRYATAQAISTFTFTKGVNTVLLASGLNFPDALAGSYLAGNENNGTGAPILLTDPNTLSPEAAAAISTLKATNVVILGGSAAVSQAVQNTLSSTKSSNATGGNLTVTRVAGPTRYDTDEAVNTQSGANTVGTDSGGVKTAILATGNNFPDALAAGALAYAKHLPLLLTDGTQPTVSSQAISVINTDAIKHVIITGGSGAVNPAQNTQLTGMGITVTQDAGPDRSATSVAIANDELNNFKFVNTHFNVANGFDPSFVGTPGTPAGFSSDALAGSPHSGNELAPTLITLSPDNNGSVCTFATNNAGTEANGHIFGGTDAVTDATAEAIEKCAGNATPPVPGNASGPPAPGTPAVTSLPQLTSASIIGTVPTSSASNSNPAGTTVQYVFSQNVSTAAINQTGFKVYTSDDTEFEAGPTATTTGVSPGGQCTSTSPNGTTSNVNCARVDPSNPNAIDVLFPNLNTTGQAGGLTLAAVAGPQSIGGPAVTTSNGTNPDGSAPIGTASTNGSTAGVTSAPDLLSVSNPRAASTTFGPNETAVDLTFDKAAYTQTAAPGGFSLAFTDSSASVTCTGPAPGTIGGGGNGTTVTGGNGTTTLTIVCPNDPNNPTAAVTASNIARAIVQADTVGTQPASGPAGACATPGANPAGAPTTSTTNFCNPLETSKTPHVAADGTPSLTGVTLNPSSGQVVYAFDQALTTLATSGAAAGNGFGFFNSNGTQVTCNTNGVTCTVTQNTPGNQVAVTFNSTTAAANTSLSNAVGGNVQAGAVTGNNTGRANLADSLGATNPTTTTVTPGTVNAPQLSSVKVNSTTGTFGGSQFGALYTFTQPVTGNVSTTGAPVDIAGGLHLYDADGTELTCAPGQATVGTLSGQSSGTGPNTVQCSSFNQAAGTGSTAATTAQAQNAVLGTADDATVNGATGSNGAGNSNPEGAANTTH